MIIFYYPLKFKFCYIRIFGMKVSVLTLKFFEKSAQC